MGVCIIVIRRAIGYKQGAQGGEVQDPPVGMNRLYCKTASVIIDNKEI